MPNWKKVVVSGSDSELNSIFTKTFRNQSEVIDSHITGSFTGSFIGDGSGLTGLPIAAITTYTNAANNRIVTSVNSSEVTAEANLTFDGSTLDVAGAIVNASSVTATQLTGSFTGSFVGDGSGLTGVGVGAGGSDSQIQYNDGGSIGGDTTFTFNDTTKGVNATSITSSFKGSLNITSSLAINQTIEGITTHRSTGETLSFGDLVYVSGSFGDVYIANASASVAVPSMMMAVDSAGNTGGTTAKLLLSGFVYDAAWSWISGQKLYLSNDISSNSMTQSAPSNTGDTVQVVGYAITEDTIYFNPSLDTIILG